MATITVRNLDDEVQRRLRLRAAAHHRSMEAEVRAILGEAVADRGFAQAWLDLAWPLPEVEIDLPERSLPREVDLG
jgi:plasmid stability protein